MSPSDLPGWNERLRTMQIIAFALVAGCVTFLGVVLFLRFGAEDAQQADGTPIMTIVSVVFAIGAVTARLVVPKVMLRSILERLDRSTSAKSVEIQLAEAYQTLMIVSMALIEGATFCAIVMYQIEGHPAALFLSLLLIVLLVLHVPTSGRVATWVKHQEERSRLDNGRIDG